jgi:hypothetical protein
MSTLPIRSTAYGDALLRQFDKVTFNAVTEWAGPNHPYFRGEQYEFIMVRETAPQLQALAVLHTQTFSRRRIVLTSWERMVAIRWTR